MAHSPSEFNAIVLSLLSDDAYWLKQAARIKTAFSELVRTNNAKVAEEWAEFFVRVLAAES